MFMGVRGGAWWVERIRIDNADTLISCARLLLDVRGRFYAALV